MSDQGEEIGNENCLSNPESVTWRQVILWESFVCNPGTYDFEARKTGEKEVGKPPNHPHALPIVLYIHDLT